MTRIFRFFHANLISVFCFFLLFNVQAQNAEQGSSGRQGKPNNLNTVRMLTYLKMNEKKADFLGIGGIMINDRGVEHYRRMLDTIKHNHKLAVLTKADLAN